MDPSTAFLLLALLGAICAVVVLNRRVTLLRVNLAEQAQHLAEQRWQEWRSRELGSIQQQYQGELAQAKVQYDELAQQSAKNALESWKVTYEQQIRQDAVGRSRSVIVGKVTEHIVPYLPEFSFNPKDARFVGSPVDLIVFDGLDAGQVERVVFVEVKTGASNLSPRERQIREAIRARRVEWQELRPAVGSPLELEVR